MKTQTLLEKLWDSHLVVPQKGDVPATLFIDLHLVHEVTSPQAFSVLRERGLKVRRPDRTVATMDHSTPTLPGRNTRLLEMADSQAVEQLQQLEKNCAQFGIPLFDMASAENGIVHVIGPELGLTQPGMTIVCGDSHTSTHGAFGSLAFGIGTSEVGYVLATQCLLQKRPKTFEVRVEGQLQPGVTAKDIILAVISKIKVDGGTGHVFEYTGSTIRGLDMEGRMTICNMSIEGGARAGIVAPDQVTFDYLQGRRFAPRGDAWDRALKRWKSLTTDDGAEYDRSVTVNAAELEPMVTYGTNPGMGIPIGGRVPDPAATEDSFERQNLDKALRYMGLTPGTAIIGQKVDVVFVGSCTNSRLGDLRDAASVLKQRKVSPGVQMLVVPGSTEVRKQAEAEGLDVIFTEAGAEWREAGCSMCLAMNGDQLQPGQYAISTSNRNFEGRQGKGSRTFLASPLTAAASAVNGVISDPRELLGVKR